MHDEQCRFVFLFLFEPLTLPSRFHLDQISRPWMLNTSIRLTSFHCESQLFFSLCFVSSDFKMQYRFVFFYRNFVVSLDFNINVPKQQNWICKKFLLQRKSHCMIPLHWQQKIEEKNKNKENKIGKNINLVPDTKCTQNPWAKSEMRMNSIYSIPRTIQSKKDNKENEEGTKDFNVHVHVSCLLAMHIGFSFHCIAQTAAPVAVTNKRTEWILNFGTIFFSFSFFECPFFIPSTCFVLLVVRYTYNALKTIHFISDFGSMFCFASICCVGVGFISGFGHMFQGHLK